MPISLDHADDEGEYLLCAMVNIVLSASHGQGKWVLINTPYRVPSSKTAFSLAHY